MEIDETSEQLPAPSPKLAWEPPTVEQLDFGSTEFAPGNPGFNDLGFYSS